MHAIKKTIRPEKGGKFDFKEETDKHFFFFTGISIEMRDLFRIDVQLTCL